LMPMNGAPLLMLNQAGAAAAYPPHYPLMPAGMPPHFYMQNFAPSAAGAPAAYSHQQQQQLAYEMANMSLGGASAGPPGLASPMQLKPSPAVTNKAALQGQMPICPVPFSAPPFAALLSAFPIPPQSAPVFSIDVECVASGPGHNDRALGHIAIVDQNGQVVVNVYVRQPHVASYLPLLTGLSAEDCAQGVTEEEALRLCRAALPKNAMLVGQNILKDVQWLQLEEGVDFDSMRDLMGLFSVRNPRFHSMTFFSLAHEAKALLSLDQQTTHHPAIDAWMSIKLFQLHLLLQQHPAEMERAKQLLLDTPVEPAFNKKNPVYEGVCMGNKAKCCCGQPHLYGNAYAPPSAAATAAAAAAAPAS